MCSVNEVEQASDNVKSKKGPKRQRNAKHFADEDSCMKCPEKATVLVRNNDPFCKGCFLDYVVHKFRATVGKARVIHQGEKVLVAVSGGSSSSAMLDLVFKGLGKAAVKKHRFQPSVVHIDDEGLCGQSVDDRNNVTRHIEELSRSAGFPYHYVSLGDLFLEQNKEASLLENLENFDISGEIPYGKNRLTKLFENVSTVTARENLLLHLYRNQLQKVAKDHEYDYIMVGDCGTNLAIRILADVAQGRGSQLPFSVGFRDDRSGVPILRPMREFTKKEIQFYNCFSNVTSFTIPSFSTKASSYGSVNRLTEELIFGLQSAFPSTVNTVLKTGDKICSNVDSTDSNHCSLCLAPLDISSGFSDVVSELTTCGSGECGSGCQKSSGDPHGTLKDTGGDNGTLRSDGHHDMVNTTGGNSSGTFGGQNSAFPSAGDVCTSGCHSSTGAGNCCNDSEDGQHSGGDTVSLATKEVKAGDGENMVPDSDSGDDQTTVTGDHSVPLASTLCYGCRLTYHDMKDGQAMLPKFVADNSRKQFQRRAMKGQIEDFLLDN